MFVSKAPRLVVSVCSTGCRATNVRTAASLKDLRARIKSVASIAKLTKTMQLVASSRLRGVTTRAGNAKHLANPGGKVTELVTYDRDTPRPLVIAVASDKGMCGSVNTQSAKSAKAVANEDRTRFSVTALGVKTSILLASEFPDSFLLSLKDFGKKEFTFPETLVAAEKLLATNPQNYTGVHIIYNHFKNVISYAPTEITVPGFSQLTKDINKFAVFDFTELEEQTLRDLFEFQVATNLWAAVHYNRNSEVAARMTSMDNATKNGNKIVADLNVAYNRGRQTAITTELVEICSGAAAVNEAAAAT